MKRAFVLALGLLFCGLPLTPAHAERSASATVTVFVTVGPHIQVMERTPSVYAGTIQSGSFSASVTFGISSNVGEVNMWVEASDLYKGGVPVNPVVPPIALDTSKNAGIAAQFGNRTNGLPNNAAWLGGAGTNIGDFPTRKSETVKYQSGQPGRFSQNVVITVGYIQPDPDKPIGQYSGKVRLNAFLTP